MGQSRTNSAKLNVGIKLVQINIIISVISILLAVGFFAAFVMIKLRLSRELKALKEKQDELTRKAYESAVLKEIGDRIGYSLDTNKIVEIISGSLEKLLPYSVVCHMIFDDKNDKILFACNIAEPVSHKFIEQIRRKMLITSSEIAQKAYFEANVDESIFGNVLNDQSQETVKSYFNVPIVISGKLVGIVNVSSFKENLYTDENTEVLFRIAKLASESETKLQDVLEREKNKLVQAVQALSDGLLMVDTKFHVILVNKKLSQLLGTVPVPSLFDVANSLSGTLDLRSMIEEALASETPLPTKEITVKDKTLQIVASCVVDSTSEKPMGVIVVFHDVTDAKSLERLRQDFTSMMVHELRAPLTSIKSTANLLQSSTNLKKDEVKNYLSTIDTTSFSMLELVNDLLDVAKMEGGKFDVIVESDDVKPFINERVEAFMPLAHQNNLKLSFIADTNLPKGSFDKVRIKQVINNLLSNAIKFTHSGEITVRVAKEIQRDELVDLVISVSDTGIGIDAEEGSKLFSRFGQLVRGRRGVALKGSGLGLYIAKGIVEAWGGRIWFKSEGAGLGVTFYFTIPASTSDASNKALYSQSKIAQA